MDSISLFDEAMFDILGSSGWHRASAEIRSPTGDWLGRYDHVPIGLAMPGTTEEVAAIVKVCASRRFISSWSLRPQWWRLIWTASPRLLWFHVSRQGWCWTEQSREARRSSMRYGISAEHGLGQAKIALADRLRPQTERALMRRIKEALDPQFLLNPGKVIAHRRPIEPAQGAHGVTLPSPDNSQKHAG